MTLKVTLSDADIKAAIRSYLASVHSLHCTTSDIKLVLTNGSVVTAEATVTKGAASTYGYGNDR